MKTLDEIELNLLLSVEDIVKKICPTDRSAKIYLPTFINNKNDKYHVYLLFNDNTLNYLCEADENGEFNIKLNKNNPFIKFFSSDNQTFSIIVKKDE